MRDDRINDIKSDENLFEKERASFYFTDISCYFHCCASLTYSVRDLTHWYNNNNYYYNGNGLMDFAIDCT